MPEISPEWTAELKKGSVQLCLLALLAQEQKYGFQILKELRDLSDGFFDLKEGTLYPALRRLEERGFVQSHWVEPEAGGGPPGEHPVTGEGGGDGPRRAAGRRPGAPEPPPRVRRGERWEAERRDRGPGRPGRGRAAVPGPLRIRSRVPASVRGGCGGPRGLHGPGPVRRGGGGLSAVSLRGLPVRRDRLPDGGQPPGGEPRRPRGGRVRLRRTDRWPGHRGRGAAGRVRGDGGGPRPVPLRLPPAPPDRVAPGPGEAGVAGARGGGPGEPPAAPPRG